MKESKKVMLGFMSIATVMVAAASITGTLAWFAANSNATVTGMSVHTKVIGDLLVAEVNRDANFETSLIQARSAVLEPASTVNGQTFYYTNPASNVDATGEAKTAAYTLYSENASPAVANSAAGKSNYDAAFQTANSITDTITSSNVANAAYAYVDYSLYIKGTNAASTAKELRLTECNLLYDGGAISTGKAWRVAVFSQVSAANTDTEGDGTLKSILGLDGCEYFTDGKAVNATDGVGTVSNFGTGAVLASYDAYATNYYKVVVRLWLEGEDTSCKNDIYASLTKEFTLDLEFRLDEEEDAVTEISSVVPTP